MKKANMSEKLREGIKQESFDKGAFIPLETLDSLNDAVIVTDTEENIIYLNESFKRLSGYNKEELEDMDFGVLSDDPEIIEGLGSEFAEKGGISGELQVKGKDATPISVPVTSSPIRNRKGPVIASVTLMLTSPSVSVQRMS